MNKQFDFGNALRKLKQHPSICLRRASWSDSKRHICLRSIDPGGMDQNYRSVIVIQLHEPEIWCPSQTDLLAEDWYEVI